jgi:TrmH family RNA methyltransferase
MTVSKLTGRNNPILKTIRLVSSDSRRAPKQLIVAEGVRVLEEACRTGQTIDAVVLSEHFGDTERERDLLAAWSEKHVRIRSISDSLFKSVSSVQNPQGAIALVRMPERRLHEIIPVSNMLIVCAYAIQDPGNLGTLIRAAAAAGADLLCTTKGTVSVRNPKVVRSSAGAIFHLPLIENIDMADFRDYCSAHSIRLYRTDARRGTSHTQADLGSPCAILLGNEGSGVSGEEYAGCHSIRIPMDEKIESLNVAMAGTIILFEAFRQRKCL